MSASRVCLYIYIIIHHTHYPSLQKSSNPELAAQRVALTRGCDRGNCQPKQGRREKVYSGALGERWGEEQQSEGEQRE
eukprot:154633-Amorphochlora_amoeboformis.AAC.1